MLDTEVAGATANSYVTIEEMDTLLEGFPAAVEAKWDSMAGENQDNQERMLREATRRVDQYVQWGERHAAEQALAFPRKVDDGAVPAEVKRAVAEYVAYLLDGTKAKLKAMQEEGVTSTGILGVSTGFQADPTGVPAGVKRELDKLAHRYWPKATENRKLDGSSDPCSFFG